MAMGRFFLLSCSWLLVVAFNTVQSQTGSFGTCVSVEAKIHTRHTPVVTVAEGDNATFLCYKKQDTTAVWRIRIWNGEYYTVEEYTENNSGVIIEPELSPEEIGEVPPSNCTTKDGEEFYYHYFRLTLIGVNVAMHQSLISCGFEANVTCDGYNKTEKCFFDDPFLMKVDFQTNTSTNTCNDNMCNNTNIFMCNSTNMCIICNSSTSNHPFSNSSINTGTMKKEFTDASIVSIAILVIVFFDNVILFICCLKQCICTKYNKVDQDPKEETKKTEEGHDEHISRKISEQPKVDLEEEKPN